MKNQLLVTILVLIGAIFYTPDILTAQKKHTKTSTKSKKDTNDVFDFFENKSKEEHVQLSKKIKEEEKEKETKKNLNLLIDFIKKGNLTEIKKLINNDQGLLNVKDKTGNTALMIAIALKKKDIVLEFLKRKSLDINIHNENFCAFSVAMKCKQIEIIKEFLKHPSLNLNIQDHDLNTCIMELCCNYPEITLDVIKNNKNINFDLQNKDGYTLLMIALWKGYNEIALEILKNKEHTINIQEKRGNTSLSFAIYRKRKDIILEMLKNKSLDLKIQNYNGISNLTQLIYYYPEIALDFIKNNENIDLQFNDNSGFSLGDLAVACEQYELFNLIQKKLAEKNLEVLKKEENSSKEDLFKKIQPNENLPYETILERVSNWNTNPEKAYKNHLSEYKKPYSKKDYELMICYHTFSDLVAYFINYLAVMVTLENGNVSYNIPGQIIFSQKNNDGISYEKKITGVFSYGVTPNKELYHKCFSIKKLEHIESELDDRIEKNETPENNFTITTATEEIKKQLALKKRSFKNFEYEENNFYIQIEDKKNDMTIRLFKNK